MSSNSRHHITHTLNRRRSYSTLRICGTSGPQSVHERSGQKCSHTTLAHNRIDHCQGPSNFGHCQNKFGKLSHHGCGYGVNEINGAKRMYGADGIYNVNTRLESKALLDKLAQFNCTMQPRLSINLSRRKLSHGWGASISTDFSNHKLNTGWPARTSFGINFSSSTNKLNPGWLVRVSIHSNRRNINHGRSIKINIRCRRHKIKHGCSTKISISSSRYKLSPG